MAQSRPPSSVVLIRWTEKGQQHPNVQRLVEKELSQHGLLLSKPKPPTANRNLNGDTMLLLAASQEILEKQAEIDLLVKPRRVAGPEGSIEVVMDHFSRKHRGQFLPRSRDHDEVCFDSHERCQLVLGLLDRISIPEDSDVRRLLVNDDDKKGNSEGKPKRKTKAGNFHSRNLRYVLERFQWIELVTPLHDDQKRKLSICQTVCFPLSQTQPPVDYICGYYGPEVAYYFAFVSFLSHWLGGLGILGLSTFVLRKYRGDTIDEDEYTPFYGLVCFLWAILLVRFWEQEEHQLAFRWGTHEMMNCTNLEQDAASRERGFCAHRRPQFKGTPRKSPATGQPELYFPPYRRKLQYLVSGLVTGLLLAVAFFVMILSLNLQGYIRANNYRYHPFHFPQFSALSEKGAYFDAESDYNSFLPVILHAVCIFTLNTLYRGVAAKLTDWENHETQTHYDNSLVLKRFLFEAFDCYIVLFYLAFYERDVDRLRCELIAVFNIDTFRRLGTEVLLPTLLHLWGGSRPDKKNKGHPYDLHLDLYEPFDDYMEVLIQFGYVVLFASAYPLASLVMAGAMWVEIRTDIYKLTYLTQKPTVPLEQIQSIGVWKKILMGMVWCSCLTNCLLFGFTSDQMMHYLPDFYIRDGDGVTHMVHDKGWIAMLIIFGLERLLIGVGLALQSVIPSIPESLSIKLQRRRFLLTRHSKKAD